MSSSFMTALPTAPHPFQKLLAAARVPGIDRVDGSGPERRLYLGECPALQFQAEQLPASRAQLARGDGEPLGHLPALQKRGRVSPGILQLDILHRHLSILPTARRLP